MLSRLESANEFLIILVKRTSGKKLVLNIRDNTDIYMDSGTNDMNDLFLDWNEHCFTWKAGGNFTVSRWT